MKMVSWRMTAAGEPLQRFETDLPTPGAGEVLVRVSGCGVCHTDLGFYYDGVKTKSPLPLTLGHEISGIVQTAGPDAENLVGKAVIIPAVLPCGTCDVCRRGLGNICRGQKMPGNDVHGGFASHALVPANGLCEVPLDANGRPAGAADLDLATLSVVADAVTTPYQAAVDAGLGPEDTAIYIGAGGVGGFGAQIAKAFGAAVIAVDVDARRLEMLSPYVDLVLNAKEMPFKDLRAAVSAFVKKSGRRPTEWKIFETSGTAAGQKTAFGLLTFGAVLSVVGFTMDSPELRLSNLMAFHAVARGNWGCVPKYYKPAVDLVLASKVRVAPFIEKFPLGRINEVFEKTHHREIINRPVMVPEG